MKTEEKQVITTDKTIAELYKAFNHLNEAFYDNSLPYPYIVIVETLKKKAYGWFTPNKVWKSTKDETVQMHEIALSAEWMNRGFMEVVQTLHHEMIHLYCETNNIKDTTNNNKYHNTTFKLECLDRGFYYDAPPHEVYGWSFAKLTDKTKELIKSWGLDEEAFSIAREIPIKKTKKSYVSKYKCDKCNATLRGKKGLKVMCYECEEMMIEEE